MPTLPTGTVTFLFTDLEGQTALWEEHPAAMRGAVARHDAILRAAVLAHDGQIVKATGDGLHAVFARAPDALDAALDAQRALAVEAWEVPGPLRARMGLHVGAGQERDGDYFGPAVNRAARVMAAGHGGQVLLSHVTAGLVLGGLPAGASLRDLGEHRLKDLREPERLFQLVVPDLPERFPPPKTLGARPNNLPIQLTSFVGRERELAEVARLLGSARLVTLTGSGGAGKTRLALQAAAELAEQHRDGIWFVDLASLSDPALVAQAALAVVGAREVPGRDPQAALLEHLSGREALLLLDNCEHLLDACARLADAIVRACPRVSVLATSRELLGVGGEVAWRVPSLGLPDDGASFAEMADSESVRLFVDRARLVQPTFALDARNASAVLQVCRRLDGIPLAVELAAARVRALSVSQIAERLDDRFALLTGGSRTALRRQQTLQALVDWSHDLLLPGERTLFRRLAVFAGGWTVEAVEGVCAGGQVAAGRVLDLMTSLVDKSLVVAEEDEDGSRYRLLETIRQYAAEKLLKAREAAAVRVRHRDWFLSLAERVEPELLGPEQARSFRRLAVEHDNLRAALAWCRHEREGADAELRLAGLLGRFWRLHGHSTEGRTRLLEALRRAPAIPTMARARVLTWLAHTYFGDVETGRAMGAEAVVAARAVGDQVLLAIALRHLGFAHTWAGDTEVAQRCYEEALAVACAAGDRRGEAYALVRLGEHALLARDDAAAARRLLEEGLALARTVDDGDLLESAVLNLGIVALDDRDDARAEMLFQEGLAAARAIGDLSSRAWAQQNLGELARWRGEVASALRFYREALRTAERTRSDDLGSIVLARLAGLRISEGKASEGVRLLAASLAWRDSQHLSNLRRLQTMIDKDVTIGRNALGDQAFEEAWSAGWAMAFRQAVAEALRTADDDEQESARRRLS